MLSPHCTGVVVPHLYPSNPRFMTAPTVFQISFNPIPAPHHAINFSVLGYPPSPFQTRGLESFRRLNTSLNSTSRCILRTLHKTPRHPTSQAPKLFPPPNHLRNLSTVTMSSAPSSPPTSTI